MKRINFEKALKQFQRSTIKYSPEILTGIGIAGMFSTIIMAITATPKATKQIHKEERRLKREENRDIKKKDCIRVAARYYVPTVITFTASAACLVGASRVNNRRNAALAAAYTLSETAFKDYQSKVKETIGAKKEQDIQDAITEDKIQKMDFKGSEIIVTGDGNTLCIDELSGQQCRTSIAKIRKVESELNKKLYNEMYISLNEFYYEVGFRQTKQGNDLGWNINDNGLIDLHFGSTLVNDEPCIVVEYRVEPRADYMRLI